MGKPLLLRNTSAQHIADGSAGSVLVGSVTAGSDSVDGYFGMREVKLGKDSGGSTRPMINGKFRFLAGFLDQSWWPDGQYLAPGDEALAFDVAVLKMYGMNMIRLHQKVNPDRWYYAADKLGIVILQDMVQHCAHLTSLICAFHSPSLIMDLARCVGADGDGAVHQGGLPAEARYYWSDLKAMIDGRGNHPSIIQWETFNEAKIVMLSRFCRAVRLANPKSLTISGRHGLALQRIGCRRVDEEV